MAIRIRKAYFDCRFGQLHVRTAFTSTGGFDERTTLLCLHPSDASSRIFEGFLPQLAADRSIYAPDAPGCGESDPPPSAAGAYAAALLDFLDSMRFRQIDVLACGDSAPAIAEVMRQRPELVRRRFELPVQDVPLLQSRSQVVEQSARAVFDAP